MREQSPAEGLLAIAWGIICNVGGGDWERESADWQEAAKRLREQYHAFLDRQIQEAM